MYLCKAIYEVFIFLWLEQKDIKAMYRDALKNSSSYQETLEEIKSFKEKKKKIEDGIKDDFVKEFDKLEIINKKIEELK